MRRLALLAAIALAALLLSRQAALAEQFKFQLTLDAGKWDRVNTPVVVGLPIKIPPSVDWQAMRSDLTAPDGHAIDCQLTPLGLGSGMANAAIETSQPCEIQFILRHLKAGEKLRLTGIIDSAQALAAKSLGFRWADDPQDRIRLFWLEKPVMDYRDAPYDNSSKAIRDRTFKVYDHLYDPDDGKRQVTKGPGGLYTHHRGLFYGFQRVSYGPNGATKVNIWECPNAHQSHEGVLSSEAGRVLGAICWPSIGTGRKNRPDRPAPYSRMSSAR